MTPEAMTADYATRPTVYRSDLLAGKTVLVTGGGSGLGRAIAFLCGRIGATVVIASRKQEKLDAAAAEMRAAGIRVETLPLNIRSVAEAEHAVAEAAARCGGLDLLVNNAGGQFPQEAIDFSEKGWNAVIDTNLSGTWHMMQAAARHWREAKRDGSIVNIVAVVERGMPGVAHTCAARAGVIHLCRTVAVEWAPLKIRVNCIAPGPIETEGMAVYPPEAKAQFHRASPMLRMGDPWEIAEAVVFLGGPSGSFITGETLCVDGGGRFWGELWTAGRPAYFDP